MFVNLVVPSRKSGVAVSIPYNIYGALDDEGQKKTSQNKEGSRRSIFIRLFQ